MSHDGIYALSDIDANRAYFDAAYRRMRRGAPLIIDRGPHIEVIRRGQRMLIDHVDAGLIEGVTFWFHRSRPTATFYAHVRHDGKSIRLHRLILSAPPGYLIDHINGDGLDNRRANLRVATPSQNCANCRMFPANKSGYRGVHWDRLAKVWRVQIKHQRNKIHVGNFSNKEDAARAYDAAAIRYHGSFARINFPESAEASPSAATAAACADASPPSVS